MPLTLYSFSVPVAVRRHDPQTPWREWGEQELIPAAELGGLLSGAPFETEGADLFEGWEDERIELTPLVLRLRMDAEAGGASAQFTFDSTKKLTKADQKAVAAYLSGQLSDGWGENGHIDKIGETRVLIEFTDWADITLEALGKSPRKPPRRPTTLIHHILNQRIEKAIAWIEGGQPLDEPDKDGKRPLTSALYVLEHRRVDAEMVAAHRALACRLIDAGADVTVFSGGGRTPLMCAAIAGDVDLCARLLDAGAPIDQGDSVHWHGEPDRLGMRALHWAVNRRHPAVVELLLERGADINARDEHGGTPLMFSRRLDLAALLLSRGADPYIANDAGRNAAEQIAFQIGHWDPEGHGQAALAIVQKAMGLVD